MSESDLALSYLGAPEWDEEEEALFCSTPWGVSLALTDLYLHLVSPCCLAALVAQRGLKDRRVFSPHEPTQGLWYCISCDAAYQLSPELAYVSTTWPEDAQALLEAWLGQTHGVLEAALLAPGVEAELAALRGQYFSEDDS